MMSSNRYSPSTFLRMTWISVRSRKVSTPPTTSPRLLRRGEAEMDTGTLAPSPRTMKMDLLTTTPAAAQAVVDDALAVAQAGPQHVPALAAHGLVRRQCR